MEDTEICVHSISVSPYSLSPWIMTLSFSDIIAKHHSSTPSSQFTHRTKTTSKPAILRIKSNFSIAQMHGRVNLGLQLQTVVGGAMPTPWTTHHKENWRPAYFQEPWRSHWNTTTLIKTWTGGQRFRQKVPVRNPEQSPAVVYQDNGQASAERLYFTLESRMRFLNSRKEKKVCFGLL